MRNPVRSGETVEICFRIPKEIGPAFRSAVMEKSNTIGGRLEGRFSLPREQALTEAAEAMGVLRAATTRVIPEENKYYGNN